MTVPESCQHLALCGYSVNNWKYRDRDTLSHIWRQVPSTILKATVPPSLLTSKDKAKHRSRLIHHGFILVIIFIFLKILPFYKVVWSLQVVLFLLLWTCFFHDPPASQTSALLHGFMLKHTCLQRKHDKATGVNFSYLWFCIVQIRSILKS